MLAALLMGCSIFDAGEDEDTGDETMTSGGGTTTDGGTSADTDPPDLPPTQGVRVMPRYRLVDVDAVVTVEEAADPQSCAPDAMDGGYLCDTEDFAGAMAVVRVERDGFEPAMRTVEVVAGSIETLNVELLPEGGGAGQWSECVVATDFESCAAACDSTQLVCAPASCSTGSEDEPVATAVVFESPDCMGEPSQSVVAGCDEPNPTDAMSWVQCCCEP
jgi:hypothetical protein